MLGRGVVKIVHLLTQNTYGEFLSDIYIERMWTDVYIFHGKSQQKMEFQETSIFYVKKICERNSRISMAILLQLYDNFMGRLETWWPF